jgi:hypothetical protein
VAAARHGLRPPCASGLAAARAPIRALEVKKINISKKCCNILQIVDEK